MRSRCGGLACVMRFAKFMLKGGSADNGPIRHVFLARALVMSTGSTKSPAPVLLHVLFLASCVPLLDLPAFGSLRGPQQTYMTLFGWPWASHGTPDCASYPLSSCTAAVKQHDLPQGFVILRNCLAFTDVMDQFSCQFICQADANHFPSATLSSTTIFKLSSSIHT